MFFDKTVIKCFKLTDNMFAKYHMKNINDLTKIVLVLYTYLLESFFIYIKNIYKYVDNI